MRKSRKSIYKLVFKRFLDIIGSFLGLLILLPLFLVLFIAIRIKHGKPVVFKQKRPGINEKVFTMYKFRTMTNKKNDKGELLPDKERLTKFGTFLRVSSLDELPELWNILKGDMSFIGPRPLLVDYLDKYSEEQKRRHRVRPGITGLAQVNGRNGISWERKFEYDISYIANLSLINDFKILIKTFSVVLLKKGVSSSTSVTMEKFVGESQEEGC